MAMKFNCEKCGQYFQYLAKLKAHTNKPCDINTFKGLYDFLKSYDGADIFDWLKVSWEGKDKQESLLRLFACFGLIDKLREFTMCRGNFNLKTIEKMRSPDDLFDNDMGELRKLKDKGDASDLTCVHRQDNRHLLATTSKNWETLNIGKLDIEKICHNFGQYNDYKLTLCVCVRSREQYDEMIANADESSREVLSVLNRCDTIILDWNDLNRAYHKFKTCDVFKSETAKMILKPHQEFGVRKTLKLKSEGNKNILWGHIQRSGKSYIIAGCINADGIKKVKCNYIVITTAPNETISQQLNVFKCDQLSDFSVIYLNGENKSPKLSNKNIIICSKQFLQTKIGGRATAIKWLKKLNFDMRFIDESHNGGTTELAQKTLDYYGKNATTIQITATYSKPVGQYNIPKKCWILWDIEDIKLCKDANIEHLAIKHGELMREVLSMFSADEIRREYAKYPELWVLTSEIKDTAKIVDLTRNNDYGWSPESVFLLRSGVGADGEIFIEPKFQNEKEALNLWYRIFGKRKEFGIPCDEYPDNDVFIKRIERICRSPMTGSRFIGDTPEPMIIMAFLPQNNISKLSKATKELLKANSVLPEYIIVSINSKTTSDPKGKIESARCEARNSGKKGVLVLSGRQCSLGVSIANCDIVLMLNNNTSFDLVYQMMFRCMTECEGKKCGFVVDLNLKRVISTTVIEYASVIRPNEHPRDATKYLLQERLISLNGDHWMPCFGKHEKRIDELCERVYALYSADTENALKHYLDKLKFAFYPLTKDEQRVFNVLFATSKNKSKIKELETIMDSDIKIGIEKIACEVDAKSNKKKIKDVNYAEILKHIVPLVCLLTIHSSETSFAEMFAVMDSDDRLRNILLEQLKSWWGKDVGIDVFRKIVDIYTKYVAGDTGTNQIIRVVKELFVKNVGNAKQLSGLIDTYFVPQEMEKKKNAEVSTPRKLRQEMLDRMPAEFWTSPKRVLEPCAGKGGFVIDIVDRFMDGMKELISCEKERYKKIVEECLYFCDINPTNIFVCRLLIDPMSEYNLNMFEGDTLKLDTGKEWDVQGFDAVIGNPPYSTDPSQQGATPMYNLFVNKFIDISGFLLFVIPSRWFVGGKGLDKFRTLMMNRKDIQLIEHEDDAKKWFGNSVEIKGGVNYFIKNSDFCGDCIFNGCSYDLSKYDRIIKPKYHELVDIVKNNDSICSLYMGQFFEYITNDKRLKKEGRTKCYISLLKSKDRIAYVDDFVALKNNTFWKVITTRAAFKAFSGFGVKFIGRPDEIHTGSYISFRVESEDEAKSLLSYFETKFANLMLSVRKISQDISKKTCMWIPLVPLDRIWDDAQIYEYFNFSGELIKIINEL